MKKIKTYLDYLEIITSVFIPYKDFDLEDFLDVLTVTIQDIMNAWAPVCIEALKMRMPQNSKRIMEVSIVSIFVVII